MNAAFATATGMSSDRCQEQPGRDDLEPSSQRESEPFGQRLAGVRRHHHQVDDARRCRQRRRDAKQ
jgi:hypothetical protein